MTAFFAKDAGKYLLFALLCFFWGVTWLAAKVSLQALPPFLSAALRFIPAGLILLAIAAARGEALKTLLWGHWRLILPSAALMITLSYGPAFWGVQFVPSGLYSVINYSLLPVSLFLIAVLFGEDRFSLRRVIALAVGVLGLTILFWPRITGTFETELVKGMVAIVIGTLVYSYSSVKSRKIMQTIPVFTLSGYQLFFGGLLFLALSVTFESPSLDNFQRLLAFEPLAGLLFMIFFGSVIAFSIYLYLIREWGASNTGLFALISPIIAVIVGVFLYKEPFGPYEAVGSLFMLGAAFIMLRGKRAAPALRARPAKT